MVLPGNMLLLFKCELNHHVDLITVYEAVDLASIYLNDFTVKTNILHTTLIYVQQNNLKFFNDLFCLVVFSCLSIIAGLTIPFRKKWNSTFKDKFRVFFLLPYLGQNASLRNKHFTFTVTKKKNPHESPRESVDPQKQQCVTAAATPLLFHSFGHGQSLNLEGKLCRWGERLRYTPHCTFMTSPCGNAWILSRMSCHDVKLV